MAAQDGEAMKAQHERMGNFEEAMVSINLQKTALSYGRVLEVCASCHAKFRD